MSITVKVGAQTREAPWADMIIEDVFAPTGDICDMPFVYLGSGAGSGMNFIPMVSELLQITYNDTRHANVILFAGPITEVQHAEMDSSQLRIEVSAEDLTRRLDAHLVAGIFIDSTVEDMVQSIITAHAPNFTLTTNPPGGVKTPILPKSFDWKKVSECFQEIAEERGYVWWIDTAGAVHFVPQSDTSNVAPITLILPQTSTDIGNFRFTSSISELKNVIFIKEFFFRSANLKFEPGDNAFPAGDTGYIIIEGESPRTVSFMFEPYDWETDLKVEVREPAGSFVTYTARDGNLEKTPGDGSGKQGSAYIYPREKKMELYRNDADQAFPANTEVRFQYRPLEDFGIPELSINVFSVVEFANRDTGIVATDGQYQFMVSFGSLEFGGTDPIITLQDYIQTILGQYSWPIISGTFDVWYTEDSTTTDTFGWRGGQRFQLQADEWNLFDYQQFYRTGLKQPINCLVDRVRTQFINPTTIKYEVSFTSRLVTTN